MRFQVYRQGRLVEKFLVCGAYLFGTDGTSMRRATVSFEEGMLKCEKPNSDTAGLSLLWPVDGFGRVLLSTTCLPERDRPYCLNVEMARARLMQTISRREDWSLFESSDELEAISRQAHALFVQAVQQSHNPAEASQLADRSLRKAMVFSEKLALRQAENLFKNRRKTKGFSRGCIGCRIDPHRMHETLYVERLAQLATFALLPVDWAALEPQKGMFDFALLDQCVEVVTKKHMVVGMGPLLQFTPETLPSWVRDINSFEKIREAAYDFVTEMATRYRRKVHRWFVIDSINVQNCLGFSVEQVLEMTRAANMAVKAVNSRAFKIIEVSNLWGEYYATIPNTVAPVGYMDMVVQSGIPFDGFSLKMRFGKNESGMHVRDMMQISSLLDYFSMLGKPLFLSGIEVPSLEGEGPYNSRVAGIWHRQWDCMRQALWLEQFFGIALGRPSVEAVICGALADGDHNVIAHSGLLDTQLDPKESFLLLRRLRETIHGSQAGSPKGD